MLQAQQRLRNIAGRKQFTKLKNFKVFSTWGWRITADRQFERFSSYGRWIICINVWSVADLFVHVSKAHYIRLLYACTDVLTHFVRYADGTVFILLFHAINSVEKLNAGKASVDALSNIENYCRVIFKMWQLQQGRSAAAVKQCDSDLLLHIEFEQKRVRHTVQYNSYVSLWWYRDVFIKTFSGFLHEWDIWNTTYLTRNKSNFHP